MLGLWLACAAVPEPVSPDPIAVWGEDPDAARSLIEALPIGERSLVVMRLLDTSPDGTDTLCALADEVVRARCERVHERPHLTEKDRRNPDDSTLWRLPPPDWTVDPAPSCSALEGEKWVQDCYFETAEATGDLARALTLCRGARATSGQCASHVLMPRWTADAGEVLAAIDEALGEAGEPVVALYWIGHVERVDDEAAQIQFRNSSGALSGRPLREAPPAWRRALPGEDWSRTPLHSSRADVRPQLEDPELDRAVAELFAEYVTTADPGVFVAQADHPSAVVRWSVALLLAQVDPGHPALEILAVDEDPRVARRAQRI
ncbi:MAG: hypothetical protein GY913_08445 [Proteobacteria bacterium]|nr:hypothetical protein [Pseudomonadota bacterium]MCP4916939.1 hypothetical protein [Pseudomonadota bacterium]